MRKEEELFFRAVELLKRGEVVAFPTETVYGLGARIFDEEAIRKIFAIKQRPSDNPLIVHVSSLREVERVARRVPETFYALAKAFWPGPLTMVLKKHPNVPSLVSAGQPTVAVRMPAHPLAWRLIWEVGEPLAAPSANLSGRPSPTKASDVEEDLGDKVALILDGGECEVGIESTVISLAHKTPVLLRPGAIGQKELEAVLKIPIRLATQQDPTCSPGMKHRHYAPRAKVRLIFSFSEIPASTPHLLSSEALPSALVFNRRNFYSRLREIDRMGAQEVVIYCGPSVQNDEGLMNRIVRSAGEEALCQTR